MSVNTLGIGILLVGCYLRCVALSATTCLSVRVDPVRVVVMSMHHTYSVVSLLAATLVYCAAMRLCSW